MTTRALLYARISRTDASVHYVLCKDHQAFSVDSDTVQRIKQLLNGQKVVVVRCEALNISGDFFRAKSASRPQPGLSG